MVASNVSKVLTAEQVLVNLNDVQIRVLKCTFTFYTILTNWLTGKSWSAFANFSFLSVVIFIFNISSARLRR
jgi:hypothetical protein